MCKDRNYCGMETLPERCDIIFNIGHDSPRNHEVDTRFRRDSLLAGELPLLPPPSDAPCLPQVNVGFVVNIVRILVGIMRHRHPAEPIQYRKTVRATLMVVPLFGLQYVVTIYRPRELGCEWQDLYQGANNLIEGSTGAIVALIYCYTNGEVSGRSMGLNLVLKGIKYIGVNHLIT